MTIWPRFLLVTPRRGLLAAFVVAVAQFVGYSGRAFEWYGLWAETQLYLGIALILSAPAAATVAAWIAIENRRGSLPGLEAAAARSRLAIQSRIALESVGWVAAGYIVGSAPAVVRTSLRATYGIFNPLYLAPGIGLLAATVAVSLWFGRWLPWVIAAPAVGVGCYLFVVAATMSVSGPMSVLTPFDYRGMALYHIPAWIVTVQALFLLAVAAALVLSLAHKKNGALVVACVASVTAATLLLVGPGDRQPDLAAADLVCTDEAPSVEVCVPQVKAYLAPDIASATEATQRETAGLGVDRVVVVDDEARGLSPATDNQIEAATQVSSGVDVWRLSQIAPQSAYSEFRKNQFFVGVASLLFPGPMAAKADAPSEQPAALPAAVLQRWFLESARVPVDGSAFAGAPVLNGSLTGFSGQPQRSLKWFRHLSRQERIGWFADNRNAIHAGELDWAAFHD